jgi:hypothetical protein
MTAKATATEPSAKHKAGSSTSSKRTTRRSAAAETVDDHLESTEEQAETAEPEEETHAASPVEDKPHSEFADEKPRFRIFVVDSGWNHPASKVLRQNFDLLHALTHEDPIYVLDVDKSVSLLRKNKGLIGHDPIISVHDLDAMGEGGPGGAHGFRLHLGLLHSEKQALSALKMFARFLGTHRETKDLESDVRRQLNGEGWVGAIEIVGGVAHSAIMEA